MCRPTALLAFLLALPPAARAATDPIDAAMQSCLDTKVSTLEMTGCIQTADRKWDDRLNRVYGRLMKSLDPASRAQLVTAQRAWLDYRTKDIAFVGGPWRQSTGTLAQITIASARLEELRARVLTLETYETGD